MKEFILMTLCIVAMMIFVYFHFIYASDVYLPMDIWGSTCTISNANWACSEEDINSQFRLPTSIALNSHGYVYVTDSWNDHIYILDDYGKLIRKWSSAGSDDGQVRFPTGIAIDSHGYVYVSDFGNSRVQKFTSDGKFVSKWGSRGSGDGQFSRPQGIAVDSHGYVYVSDFGNSRVQKFTSDGKFVSKWGSRGSGDGQFFRPQGIAVDSQGYVYVTDSANDLIQKFSNTGQFIVKFEPYFYSSDSPNPKFQGPTGIAVSPKTQLVYLSDTWSDTIQIFYPSSST